LGENVQRYTHHLLSTAASYYHLTEPIGVFNETMTQLVSSAGAFRLTLGAAHAQGTGMSMDEFTAGLETLLANILEELKAEFPSPTRAPSHEERKALVAKIMSRVEEGIVHLGIKAGVSEESVRSHFRDLSPHVERLVVTTGALLTSLSPHVHPLMCHSTLFRRSGGTTPCPPLGTAIFCNRSPHTRSLTSPTPSQSVRFRTAGSHQRSNFLSKTLIHSTSYMSCNRFCRCMGSASFLGGSSCTW